MKIIKILVAFGTPLAAGFIGSFFTTPMIETWYADLTKPALNPPNWIFGPVWTALYLLMGGAAYMVWTRGWHRSDVKAALTVFFVHLVFNASWSIVFFGFKDPLGALIVIALLWGLIAWMIYLFYPISRIAAWLLVPYLLWVSFAAYLNLSILLLN